MPFREHTTGNIEAYKFYIQGGYRDELRQGSSFNNYDKALRADSTFAIAALSYAHLCNHFQISNYSAKKYIDQAMRHRQRLTDYYNIFVQVDKYRIYGDLDKAVELLELQCELHPYDFELLSQLIDIYYVATMTAKGEKAIKRLNELVPDYPDYQIMLARNYLRSNDIGKGLKYTEERIEEHPENTGLLFKKGQFLLHKSDLDNAEKVFQKVMLLSPENEKVFSLIMDHISYIRDNTSKNNDLDKFTGRYRNESSEYFGDILLHTNHLLREGPNMVGSIYYPLSDTSFVAFFGAAQNSLESMNSQFVIDERGKVVKLIDHQSNLNHPLIYWKQDSLILNALRLFESGRDQEVLNAFQRAYSENPEHYYLANYIKHLEFIQSNDYEESKLVLESSLGEYDVGRIYMEDDKFFLDANSVDYQILPLSEDQFMNPSQYYYTIQIVKEGDQISGFKVIFNNGNEIFVERTSLISER